MTVLLYSVDCYYTFKPLRHSGIPGIRSDEFETKKSSLNFFLIPMESIFFLVGERG